ncbi:MAG: DUF262 domain-containing protein [Cyanobacteria bacterium RI_101]|nr:DUF262 domain-containing protein [Cyanobacteria bacterium RI_101]
MYYSISPRQPVNELRRNIHSLSWFWDHYQRGLLNLTPSYQQVSAWNQEYQDYFIDTILNNYPSPAIFLCQTITDDGYSKLSIVDGKQRLSTLFEFIEGKFPVYDKATLENLRGKYFTDFESEAKQRFWQYQFAVEYLPENEGIINLIFDRINRNTIKLTPQELRHAKFDGEFINAVEDLSDWMFSRLGDNFPAIDKRSKKQMKDCELVAELLLFLEDGARALSQDYLDKAFSDRDLNWENKQSVTDEFRTVIETVKAIAEADQSLSLTKTRLKNQADFYSLFGAVAELQRENRLNSDYSLIARHLHDFISEIEEEGKELAERLLQEASPRDNALRDYYNAVKTRFTDAGQRKQRITIIKNIILDAES